MPLTSLRCETFCHRRRGAAVFLIAACTAFVLLAGEAKADTRAVRFTATDDGACDDGPEARPEWMAAIDNPLDTAVEYAEQQIVMSDGEELGLRWYRPLAYEGPLPTVLWWTPYSSDHSVSKDPTKQKHACWISFFVRRGYAFVWADLRGTSSSDGCFDWSGSRDREDGRALVDWITQQPWSDGSLGMRGYSAEGLSQFSASIGAGDAVKAIIPTSAPDMYANTRPGATKWDASPLAIAFWTVLFERPTDACDNDFREHVLLNDGTFDEWWRERSVHLAADQIEAAVLYATGRPHDNIRTYKTFWDALQQARVPVKGYIGPWAHDNPTIPGWFFYELRWFEHWLRGNDTGVMRERPLTVFDDAMQPQELLGFAHRRVQLEVGAGALGRKAAPGETVYTDVPNTQRQVVFTTPSMRALYSSDAVEDRVVLSGDPVLELTATLSTPDTNFAVHLYDHAPDGSYRHLTGGWLDARHREGLDRPGQDVTPGVPLDYRIPLGTVHHALQPGHKLILTIASSDASPTAEFIAHMPFRDSQFPVVGGPLYSNYGIFSDPVAADVTVHEGGRTRLMLPIDEGKFD